MNFMKGYSLQFYKQEEKISQKIKKEYMKKKFKINLTIIQQEKFKNGKNWKI